MSDDNQTEQSEKPVTPAKTLANPARVDVPDEVETDEVDTVVLVAANLPFYVSSFEVENEDGSTLVFDRNGTEVPSEDAERLTETAAAHGVALTEKDN